MFRKCLVCSALVAIAFGCSKKNTSSTETPDQTVISDSGPSGPTITLKFREKKVGDKSIVTGTNNQSITNTVTGPQGKKQEAPKTVEKYEYIEVILEMPAGAELPTKFTRHYKIAEQRLGDGPLMKPSYVGKTVLFEKKDGQYTISADGKPLPEEEDKIFHLALNKPSELKESDFAPKKPVAINESWTVDPAVIEKWANSIGFPINRAKSHATSKLAKAYIKDDKQWGVIESKIDFVIEGEDRGTTAFGSLTLDVTLDMVLDGSSIEKVMNSKRKGRIAGKNGVFQIDWVVEGDSVETQTPIK